MSETATGMRDICVTKTAEATEGGGGCAMTAGRDAAAGLGFATALAMLGLMLLRRRGHRMYA